MLLAIDCGNTQTVIGLFNDHELVDHWRIATAADRTSDELALMFQQFLGFHGFSFDAHVSGVAIASGVPRVTAALREMTARYFGYEALVLEPGVLHEEHDALAPVKLGKGYRFTFRYTVDDLETVKDLRQ